jgi:hypothetical protein
MGRQQNQALDERRTTIALPQLRPSEGALLRSLRGSTTLKESLRDLLGRGMGELSMRVSHTASSASEGHWLRSWHAERAPVTPEFIAGTFAAQRRLNACDEDRFKSEGVSLKALRCPAPVRTGRIVFKGNGFEIEPYNCTSAESNPACLFLVTDRHGQAQDIVAWAPETGRMAAWLQRAWALGQDMIYRPRLSDHQGLRVWRSPWGWLRAGREGIVPVRLSALPFQLDCAGPLTVEDTAYGRELEAIITPALPRITVPVSEGLAP